MNTYEVKFEIYGKKLKVTIQAANEIDAIKTIKEDIIFHSIEEIEPVSDPEFVGNKTIFKNLMDIFNLKP